MTPRFDPSIWKTLQIEPTSDVRAIKRAYAKILKTCHPEENPQAFGALRQAFESAMEFARVFNQIYPKDMQVEEITQSSVSFSNTPNGPFPDPGEEAQSQVLVEENIQPIAFAQASEQAMSDANQELPAALEEALQNLQTTHACQSALNRLDSVFREGQDEARFASQVFSKVVDDTQKGLLSEQVLGEMARRWFFKDDHFEFFFSVKLPHRLLMTEQMQSALIAPISKNLQQLYNFLKDKDFQSLLHHLQSAMNHPDFDHLSLRQWFRLELMRFFSNHHDQIPDTILVHLPELFIWNDLRPFESDADEVLANQLEQAISQADRAVLALRSQEEKEQHFSRFSRRFLLRFLIAIVVAYALLGLTRSCFSQLPHPQDRQVLALPELEIHALKVIHKEDL